MQAGGWKELLLQGFDLETGEIEIDLTEEEKVSV